MMGTRWVGQVLPREPGRWDSGCHRSKVVGTGVVRGTRQQDRDCLSELQGLSVEPDGVAQWLSRDPDGPRQLLPMEPGRQGTKQNKPATTKNLNNN